MTSGSAAAPAPAIDAASFAPPVTPARTTAIRTPRAAWSEPLALAAIALWIPLQLLATWPAPLTPAFDGPWRYDTSIFVYEGALVRHGALPYLAFWDHKGPLIYLLNAAGLSISGGQLWGVWLIGLLTLWLAAAVGYRTMRDAFGVPAALIGLVLFTFAIGGFETGANMTEEYALPLAWGAALAFVHWTRTRRASLRTGIALGVLGTLAFFLRANLAGAATSAALTAVALLLAERRFAEIARMALGAVLGSVIVASPILGWLAHGGAMGAFWDQAIRYNLLYTQAEAQQRILSAIAGVWLATATAPLVLPAAGIVVCARGLRRSRPHDRTFAIALFALIWVAVELVFASISGRPYDHYFIMLVPPLALLTAALISELSSLAPVPRSWRGRVRSPLFIAALFAMVMVRPLVASLVLRAREGGLVPERAHSQVVQTADYVRGNSATSDRLLVWGLSGGLYFLAQRPAASRYLFAFPLLTRGYGDSVAVDFLAGLRRAPPAMIVDASVADASAPPLSRWDPSWRFPRLSWYAPYRTMTPALRPFYDFVAQNYTAVAVVGPERWIVYRANARSAKR